jgi:hypothetical protein
MTYFVYIKFYGNATRCDVYGDEEDDEDKDGDEDDHKSPKRKTGNLDVLLLPKPPRAIHWTALKKRSRKKEDSDFGPSPGRPRKKAPAPSREGHANGGTCGKKASPRKRVAEDSDEECSLVIFERWYRWRHRESHTVWYDADRFPDNVRVEPTELAV